MIKLDIINFFNRLQNYVKRKRFKPFIENISGGITSLNKKALVYYKNEGFTDKAKIEIYAHPNTWESTEIARILNSFGFSVDAIDRISDDFLPEDKYDLFLGLGSGNSGRHFAKYAKRLSKATKILYATGADPTLSNQLNIARYRDFTSRTGIQAEPMRFRNINFDKFISYADTIFCIGETNNFSYCSYKKYNKPIYPILPGTDPNITFNSGWLYQRKLNTFHCRAGNGFIYKGVDLLVEAFLQNPHLELIISGPDSETAFFKAYGDKINSAKNINYLGFVNDKDVSGLWEKASFVISSSISEGCATSVLTCMRRGQVPVLNKATGIDIANIGFEIKDGENTIENISAVINQVSKIDHGEYRRRVFDTLIRSQNFTQGAFRRSFSEALLSIMENIA